MMCVFHSMRTFPFLNVNCLNVSLAHQISSFPASHKMTIFAVVLVQYHCNRILLSRIVQMLIAQCVASTWCQVEGVCEDSYQVRFEWEWTIQGRC